MRGVFNLVLDAKGKKVVESESHDLRTGEGGAFEAGWGVRSLEEGRRGGENHYFGGLRGREGGGTFAE